MPPSSDEIILKYLTMHEGKEGITANWYNALLAMIRRITAYSEKTPAQWDTDEVLKIATAIRKSKYSQNYKRNLIRHLRPFVLWLAKSNKKIDIEEIKGIKIPDAVWKTKKPEDMLTVEEVTTVIKAGSNPRDRCLLSMLYDTSCRPIEILPLKWGDLQRDEYGVFFATRAKTGKERRIRLTNISLPFLNEWQNLHPDTSSEGYVFRPGIFKGLPDNRPMTKTGFDNLIEHIRHRTGITKLKPGIMRSVRITHDVQSGYPTQYIMLKNWGSLKTKMLDLYANPGKDYIDQTALRQAGMSKVKESKSKENYKLEPPVCPACGTVNFAGSMWCSHCQTPLTQEASAKVQTTKERIEDTPEFKAAFEAAMAAIKATRK